jgi:hypothetical protein
VEKISRQVNKLLGSFLMVDLRCYLQFFPRLLGFLILYLRGEDVKDPYSHVCVYLQTSDSSCLTYTLCRCSVCCCNAM